MLADTQPLESSYYGIPCLGAKRPRAVGYELSHIPTHYEDKSETEFAPYVFTGWSVQRDRYGAFKLKPSEVRFQLVLYN